MALLQASDPTAALTAFLQAGAVGHTWVAATAGSMPAAGYQLASGAPVMPLGGFNGTDPSPTLAQFQALVASGQVHYFVGEGLSEVPDTGGQRRHRADHGVGEGALRRDDGRRDDGLRPDGADVVRWPSAS